MRVAQVFKRLLGLERERVLGVAVEGEGPGRCAVVELGLPGRRRQRCSGCAQVVAAVYDHPDPPLAAHLDAARARLVVRARLARVSCPGCGVRPEQVYFARPGARFTRAFEDTVCWLLKAAPRAVVARLMRVDRKTAGRMAERVVAEQRARRGGDGLDGLARIGTDEGQLPAWAPPPERGGLPRRGPGGVVCPGGAPGRGGGVRSRPGPRALRAPAGHLARPGPGLPGRGPGPCPPAAVGRPPDRRRAARPAADRTTALTAWRPAWSATPRKSSAPSFCGSPAPAWRRSTPPCASSPTGPVASAAWRA